METRNLVEFYSLEINRAVARVMAMLVARVMAMFQVNHAGCSLRAVIWFCPEMGLAYQGAIKVGVGGTGGTIADMMRSNFGNRMSSIAEEYRIETFSAEERRV